MSRRESFLLYGFLLALVVGAFWIFDSAQGERADQTCDINERAQAQKVKVLGDTYRFLVAQQASGETDTVIYKFIIADLPKQEAEAKVDEAQPFCDEPGVGLPSGRSDPPIPERPSSL